MNYRATPKHTITSKIWVPDGWQSYAANVVLTAALSCILFIFLRVLFERIQLFFPLTFISLLTP